MRTILKGEPASDKDLPAGSVCKGRITETSSLLRQSRILEERIDTSEVGMVEGIEHGCMELKRRSLGYLDLFKDADVCNVGDGILGHVASRVAEWRPKKRLRLSGIDDEA